MGVITGSNGVNDRLEGTTDKDSISGLSGNDTLIGGAERDTLFGGDGDDIIDTAGYAGGFQSRSQDDVVDGGAGWDIVSLDYSDLVWVSTEKPIELHMTFSTATFQIQVQGYVGATVAGCEQMYLWCPDGDDFIEAGAGDDFIAAFDGRDTIKGGGGDDIISDTDGKFDLDGGSGSDQIRFDWTMRSGNMTYDLASGIGQVGGLQIGKALNFESLVMYSAGGADKFTGGELNDTIYAGQGNNTLYAGGGDDMLTTGDGLDRITAGAGNDTVNALGGNDNVDGGDGDDRIEAGAGLDTIFGRGGDDYINGGTIFGADSDLIDGGAGDDTIRLASNIDAFIASAATVEGGAGKDVLYWVGGFKAAGKLDLTGGSAAVPGGGSISGFETYYIGAALGDDTVITAAGDDTINGSNGNDRLEGAGGDDHIEGGSGLDTLLGGAGDDKLWAYVDFGSSSNDNGHNVLEGGDGDDTVNAQAGDEAFGGAGKDLLSFAWDAVDGVSLNLKKQGQPDAAVPITGFERYEGSNQADTIVGSNFREQIVGGAGADFINAGKGADIVWGVTGADTIKLGGGEDTLVLFQLWEQADIIKDFHVGEDHIRMDGFSRVMPAGDLDPSRLLLGEWAGTPTATIAGAQLMYDTADGGLWVDWDGTGGTYAPQLQMIFQGLPELSASDFSVSLIG